MALTFDGSTQYVSNGSAGLASPTMTIGAWFRPDTSTGTQDIVALSHVSGSTTYEHRLIANSSNTVSCLSMYSTPPTTIVVSTADSSNTFTDGAWSYVIGSWINFRRKVSLNGGTVANSGFQSHNTSPTVTHIGARNASLGFFDGSIGEVAVWNTDLLASADVASIISALSSGADPLLFVSLGLTNLFRFINGELQDVIGGFSLSATGSPTTIDHPGIWYPRAPLILPPPPIVELSAALTATTTLSSAITRTRNLSTALTGTCTLNASLSRTRPLASSLTAVATLDASLSRTITLVADLTGTGDLTAAAQRIAIPAEGDVREGIVYGREDDHTGLLRLPVPSDVLCGTEYGAPSTPGANVGLVPASGNVRKDVIYGTEDALTGTMVVPDPSTVRCGVEYGSLE